MSADAADDVVSHPAVLANYDKFDIAAFPPKMLKGIYDLQMPFARFNGTDDNETDALFYRRKCSFRILRKTGRWRRSLDVCAKVKMAYGQVFRQFSEI